VLGELGDGALSLIVDAHGSDQPWHHR
jgi:hypothetical protein